jgi:hypothetical protein
MKQPKFFALNLFTGVVLVLCVLFAMFVVDADGRESKPTGLVICEVFPDRYCGQALRVAWCESRLSVNARNGQYRGLFQMGSWERRRYGHGPDARTQARAALRYFNASGRTWRPWTCRWAA